jgi:hypothetical protein
MEIIKNSDIDFSKYGWVKEVSTLTGIKEQKVGKLMKKYLPDFYNKCFKRKIGPIAQLNEHITTDDKAEGLSPSGVTISRCKPVIG